MDNLAKDVQIGADRLLYMPYLMGERTPHLDANARGAFVGLSAIHEKKHLIRAVMEGVGYSLKDCLGILEEMGVASDDMRLCGGGAKSKLWREIITDTFGVSGSVTENDEGPAFGAAILAMVGTGIYKDTESACDCIVKAKETISVNSENHNRYMKYYEVYKGLYQSLKNDFAKLAEVCEK